MNFIYYLLAGVKQPAPLQLVLGFVETTRLFGDPAISDPESDRRVELAPTERLIDAGFTVAGIHYTELSLDTMFTEDGYYGRVRAC